MKKIVALTGASGNMGLETVAQLMESDVVGKIKVLLLKCKRTIDFWNSYGIIMV